jgi:hypothetical protein
VSTATGHFLVTTAGIITAIAGIIAILRTLWNIRGSWDATNTQLKLLVSEVKHITVDQARADAILREKDNILERRIERHEQWHDKH